MAITTGSRDSKQDEREVLKENKALLNLKESLGPQCEETFGISPEEKVVTPHQLNKPQTTFKSNPLTMVQASRPKSTYVLPNAGALMHAAKDRSIKLLQNCKKLLTHDSFETD